MASVLNGRLMTAVKLYNIDFPYQQGVSPLEICISEVASTTNWIHMYKKSTSFVAQDAL